MTKQEFIKAIAAAAQKYAPKYGIKVVSPVIAQACLESGYGTSNKAKYHNYFGLKYRKGRVTCNSGYFSDGSQEQRADGSYIPVTTDWYSFASLDVGVEGYFQFINCSLYANLKGITDPKKYLETIKADGYATSLNYVDNVYKVITSNNLTQYDNIKEEKKMGYTNSSLVNCTVKSPNHSGTRTHAIDRITPHCVVGQLSAESIGGCFTSPSRQASCNYGIGYDGRVCLIVDEANRSWGSSSSANDQRAITIEVASDKTEPYAFKEAAYNKLVDLCVDICKRNGKNKLLWFSDKNTALNYNPKSNEMVLTVHRWFANKSCPGNWMFARMGDLANQVTARLGGSVAVEPVKPTQPAAPTQTSNGFTDGQVIKLKDGATYYNGKAIPAWVFKSTLYYRGSNSDGIIFSTKKTGAITGVVKPEMIVGGNASSQAPQTQPAASYMVRVTADALNIRKGPGTSYAIVGCIRDKGAYTIIGESNGFGQLKSGAGWISLSYTKRI